jgi:hypothetical protein
MLTFSSTQLTQFEDRLIGRFAERTAKAMLADNPGPAGVDLPEMRRRIALAVRRGRAYGIRIDSQLAAFASLMIAYGPDFDEHPAVKAVLTDRGIADTHRMDALRDRLARRHLEELALLADHRRWQDAGPGAP